MPKTITWIEKDGFQDAFIGDKQVGSYWLSIEQDGYHWVSGSKNGLEINQIEAINSIEKIVKH